MKSTKVACFHWRSAYIFEPENAHPPINASYLNFQYFCQIFAKNRKFIILKKKFRILFNIEKLEERKFLFKTYFSLIFLKFMKAELRFFVQLILFLSNEVARGNRHLTHSLSSLYILNLELSPIRRDVAYFKHFFPIIFMTFYFD